MMIYKPENTKDQKAELIATRQKIWENVRRINSESAKLTVAQFYKTLRIASNTQWEALKNGSTDFQFERLVDVARGLNCKLSDLVEGI